MSRPEYRMYVPSDAARHDVRPKSAIVGERQGALIHTHYEGGGAHNVQTFEERLHHAASRREARYPTIAQRGWDPEDVIEVGAIRYDEDLRHWVIADVTDVAALQQWLSEESIPPIGGSQDLLEQAAGRAYSKLSPSDHARLAVYRSDRVAMAREILRITAARR